MNKTNVAGNRRDSKNVALRSLSLGAALVAISGAAWLGLFLPDLDLILLPVLHHRSIITHSVILVVLVHRWLPDSIYVGLLLGVSIHLWADSISTSIGFAQVYLPIVKEGIGATASMAWLLGNALVAFLIAVSHHRSLAWLVVPLFVAIAFAYAILNEGAAFLVYVVAVVGCAMYVRHLFRKRKGQKRQI